MKNALFLAVMLLSTSLMAQRDMTPSKRGDAFGTRDFRNLNNYGLQFQLGPTFTLTRLNNETFDTDFAADGFRGNYTHDPITRVGVYGEIGMAHFPMKRSRLSKKLKTILISYYDWGIGFKYFRGGEGMTVNYVDPGGVVTFTEDYEHNFSQGNVYGRFSIHRNIHIGDKFFLDNSLGINLDYRVMQDADAYGPGAPMTSNEKTSEAFYAQLHYGLGLGFKLKRGSYIIPGVRAPILGMYEWNKGNPSLRQFSSKYWPLLVHIKFIYLFEKKAKGCPAVETNDQDKETNRSR